MCIHLQIWQQNATSAVYAHCNIRNSLLHAIYFVTKKIDFLLYTHIYCVLLFLQTGGSQKRIKLFESSAKNFAIYIVYCSLNFSQNILLFQRKID